MPSTAFLQFLLSHWITWIIFSVNSIVGLTVLSYPLCYCCGGPVINYLGPDFCLISRSCWIITDRCHQRWVWSQTSQGYPSEEIPLATTIYIVGALIMSWTYIYHYGAALLRLQCSSCYGRKGTDDEVSLSIISRASHDKGSSPCSQTKVVPGEMV